MGKREGEGGKRRVHGGRHDWMKRNHQKWGPRYEEEVEKEKLTGTVLMVTGRGKARL